MTTGTGWRVDWWYGGAEGSTTDVQCRWQESASMWGGSGRPAVRRVQVTGVIPGFDPVAAANRRVLPSSGRMAVYRGDTLLIAGPITDLRYRGSSRPISCTVSETAEDDTIRIPTRGDVTRLVAQPELAADITRALNEATPPWHSIDTTGWAASAPRVQGRYYPMVIGAPGTSSAPGSPAYIIDTTGAAGEILIAGHRVSASTVTVWGPNAAGEFVAEAGVPVLHQRDGYGQEVAYVQESDLATVKIDAAADYYVSWTGGEARPGGAGDVVLDLLTLSSLSVDTGAWQAVRSRLNAYTLAGYLDESTSPAEYAESAVLPLLPVSVYRGPRGLAPQLWPYLDELRGGPHLEVGVGGVQLAGEVSYLDARPLRSVIVEYGRRPDEGVYTGRASADAARTLRGRLGLFGSRGAEETTIRAGLVWDGATAQRIAADLMRARGWPRRVVPLQIVDVDRYGIEGYEPLRVGQPVRLTCEEVELTAERAMVGAIERDGIRLRVEVHLHDDPIE